MEGADAGSHSNSPSPSNSAVCLRGGCAYTQAALATERTMPIDDPLIPDLPHPRRVLEAHGLRARRSFGQNFLVAAADFDRIVEAAGVRPDEAVLEIGAGLGALTARLAARARRTVAVEVDRGLHAVAAETLRAFDNVELLLGDFLAGKHGINPDVTRAARAAQETTGRPLKVVSNLPYSISSPVIVCLLEWEVPVGEMFLMLQEEVADRVMAAPGGREYGPLTVTVGYWAEAEVVFTLGRGAFWPPPQVRSALVRIEKRRAEAGADYAAFSALVARLFSQRRKTLGHTLREGWGEERTRATLESAGVAETARVETLSVQQLRALARALGTTAGPPHPHR
jgi:16S rRNA (adenine1518-N6/adenine1519-N6)-dimethyltransferase